MNTASSIEKATANGLISASDANAANAAMFQQVIDFNSAEAQKNRDFQEYMSNTQYQRLVKDLEKAGINPLMAVQGMNPSSPTGSSASGSSSSFSDDSTVVSALLRGLSQLGSSALKLISLLA